MKIKLYIVTYRGSEKVHNNLMSLFKSDLLDHEYEINIINNHSEFKIEYDFLHKYNLHIMHNVLRPDFSNGHLSRNWNQAIINGFENLNNPVCDIVCHCQDDTIFMVDWVKKLIEAHKKYTFIQYGLGDNFCSYLPESIKNIGLWDERFNSITMQGADYFTRAVLYNREKTSITDRGHQRIHNPLDNLNIIKRPPGDNWSQEHKSYGIKFFELKWGMGGGDAFNRSKEKNIKSKIINYIIYPYFEKDVYDLENKGYFV